MKVIARVAASAIPAGTMLRVEHPPFDVLVANVDGELLAIEDACPHSSESLSSGTLKGCTVQCRGHDWLIDLRSGRVLAPAHCTAENPVYTVRIEGDQVLICDER